MTKPSLGSAIQEESFSSPLENLLGKMKALQSANKRQVCNEYKPVYLIYTYLLDSILSL
jgi:hypothetical protein